MTMLVDGLLVTVRTRVQYPAAPPTKAPDLGKSGFFVGYRRGMNSPAALYY